MDEKKREKNRKEMDELRKQYEDVKACGGSW
jgi:hypothetical protein